MDQIAMSRSSQEISCSFSRQELIWINNALNEVCNGIDIEESEFVTRLGGNRNELVELLRRIGLLTDKSSAQQ
jgi:hypothetical protein